MNKTKPYTYADLGNDIAKMNDKQKAEQVRWWGEEKGGEISKITFLEDDYVDTGGDSMEQATVSRQNHDTAKEFYENVTDAWDKGTPILVDSNL